MNMLVKSSAVVAAATALPAVAEARAAVAPALPPVAAEPAAALPVMPAPIEPTPIEKLWAERNAMREQVRAAYRFVHRIERKAWQSAGTPSREITYSAASDRLGLERWGFRRPYIDPPRIEAALRNNGPTGFKLELPAGRSPILSKRQAARQERLKALLKISRLHDAKVRDYLDVHGFNEANDKAEWLTRKQGALEWRILKMPSKNVRDLEIKFALAREWDDSSNHPGAQSIAADMRRVMHRPDLVKVFAEA